MTGISQNTDDYYLACYHDFPTFVEFAFDTLFPHKEFIYNWHIDAMAEQLLQSYEGRCQRLIINMPPRMLKSIVCSVAYPAWVLGRNPSAEIMCVSYGDELVKELGDLSLRLLQSRRYRQVFPNARLAATRPSVNNLKIIGGGRRLGISAGGAITGRGADTIIIDDPLKASDARTRERELINQWYDDNIYQRINNKNKGAVIVVMQRLHEADLTGHLLAKPEKWFLMRLPAVAEEAQHYAMPGGHTYYRQNGEILHPGMESAERLATVKVNLGSYVFAAQYQQQPECDSEALIRREWFKIISRQDWPETFDLVVQSWDTAHKVEESNDYSVGITMGLKDNRYYVLDVIRKKMPFPELMAQLRATYHTQHETDLLVEDAASGQTIIQVLIGEGIPVKKYKPIGDKFTRLSGVSGIIESGLVHLPEGTSWLEDFLMEITRFPNSRHDDQVDALSQGLAWLEQARRGLTDCYAWSVPSPYMSNADYLLT